jgi:uncharacterized membrane protein (UPF0127 family)
MQSASHKRFSRISTTIFVTVTLIVVVWLIADISSDVKTPFGQTETPTQSASTTSAMPVRPAPVAPPPSMRLIQAPQGTLKVEIAATDATREQGLSGHAPLPKDSGMLFVFPNAGVYGFWMKDMQFPLDMVWIGADQKVSGVAPGVTPQSFPEIFYPPTDVLYVLELPAGSAADHRIATGTQLRF